MRSNARSDRKCLRPEANLLAPAPPQDAPFFTEKLKVRVLPCVIAFKSGIAVDRITGFEGIPGAGNDFKTEAVGGMRRNGREINCTCAAMSACRQASASCRALPPLASRSWKTGWPWRTSCTGPKRGWTGKRSSGTRRARCAGASTRVAPSRTKTLTFRTRATLRRAEGDALPVRHSQWTSRTQRCASESVNA